MNVSNSIGAGNAYQSENVNEAEASRKSGNYGKTIGNAKLSETGAKYYEELKKKFSNMDFILVSKDEVPNAQSKAASFANPGKMVVLVDEDKIERMATDEKFRNQYEGIIKRAASGIDQLQASMEKSGQAGNVKGYGMKLNDDGTMSYFAVLKKSSADQKARIEKKAEQKKADQKAADKKAAQKAAEERIEDARGKANGVTKDSDEETLTITANSIEELMKKIGDYSLSERSNSVQTDYEKMLGQSIDFRG